MKSEYVTETNLSNWLTNDYGCYEKYSTSIYLSTILKRKCARIPVKCTDAKVHIKYTEWNVHRHSLLAGGHLVRTNLITTERKMCMCVSVYLLRTLHKYSFASFSLHLKRRLRTNSVSSRNPQKAQQYRNIRWRWTLKECPLINQTV